MARRVWSLGMEGRIVLALIHPLPSLTITAAAIGFAVAFGIRPADPRLVKLAATMLLAQFGISALNDWADREVDAKAGRLRPLPLGLVSPGAALAVAVASAAGALGVAATLGLPATLLALLGIGTGWVYDLVLKPTPFSAIPFAVGFPLLPLWVGLIAGRMGTPLLLLVAAGVPIAVAIHLADAVPDRAGDWAAGSRTLAVILGRPRAEVAAICLLALGAAILSTGLMSTHPAVAVAAFSVALLAGVSYAALVVVRPGPPAGGSRWVIVAGALACVSIWFKGS